MPDTMDTMRIKSSLHHLDTQLGILGRTSGNDAASRSVGQLTQHVRTLVGIVESLVKEIEVE